MDEDIGVQPGRRAFNAYDQDTTTRSDNYDNVRASAWHPVVRTHPATGRKALYVNRLMTREIEGLPREESESILQMLFDHQEQQKFVYQHVWRPDDILIAKDGSLLVSDDWAGAVYRISYAK